IDIGGTNTAGKIDPSKIPESGYVTAELTKTFESNDVSADITVKADGKVYKFQKDFNLLNDAGEVSSVELTFSDFTLSE
ncbi:MAG: hypothetical protein J5766_02795, partial [Clostridia bacterium]|nr:hypothetical protein [Clostridia bacterium]